MARLQSQAHTAAPQSQHTKQSCGKSLSFSHAGQTLCIATVIWNKYVYDGQKGYLQQGYCQNAGWRKPCFNLLFIVHLHIQLDLIYLAMCISSSFLSLLSSGQPGGRNSIPCTSAIPVRWKQKTIHPGQIRDNEDFWVELGLAKKPINAMPAIT